MCVDPFSLPPLLCPIPLLLLFSCLPSTRSVFAPPPFVFLLPSFVCHNEEKKERREVPLFGFFNQQNKQTNKHANKHTFPRPSSALVPWALSRGDATSRETKLLAAAAPMPMTLTATALAAMAVTGVTPTPTLSPTPPTKFPRTIPIKLFTWTSTVVTASVDYHAAGYSTHG